MTVHITLESALSALRDAVALKGEDYVYDDETGRMAASGPRCRYAVEVDGKAVPDCIVGHVLVAHGIPAELLVWRPYDENVDNFGSGAASQLMDQLKAASYITYEWDAMIALNNAQFKQDNCYTWGEALEAAEGN